LPLLKFQPSYLPDSLSARSILFRVSAVQSNLSQKWVKLPGNWHWCRQYLIYWKWEPKTNASITIIQSTLDYTCTC